jgi:hypothetical protein
MVICHAGSITFADEAVRACWVLAEGPSARRRTVANETTIETGACSHCRVSVEVA